MRPVFPPQIRWNLDLDFDAPEPESVDRARLHDNLIASPHHFEPSVLQRILRLIALILIGVDGYAFSLPFPIQDYPLALGYGLIFQDQIAIVPPGRSDTASLYPRSRSSRYLYASLSDRQTRSI